MAPSQFTITIHLKNGEVDLSDIFHYCSKIMHGKSEKERETSFKMLMYMRSYIFYFGNKLSVGLYDILPSPQPPPASMKVALKLPQPYTRSLLIKVF